MTTDSIKELVKRLREKDDFELAAAADEAADALEAMAGEVERLKETITTAVQFNEGLAAERDRLAGEVDAITQLCADEQKKRVELICKRDRLAGEVERLKGALEKIVQAEYSGGAKTAIARSALEAKP